MNQIESEIRQVSEKKEEYEYGFDGKIETLNVSSIVNSILFYFSRDWSEEERKRLLLNEQECQLFDKAITPWIYNVAVRIGLAVAEAFSIVVVTGLLLPRIFVLLSKKREQKTNVVDKVGA